MNTETTSPQSVSYLVNTGKRKGLLAFITSTDHKRISLLYLSSIAIFFVVGVLLGEAMRLELFWPGQQFYDAQTYNAIFTVHGIIMIFLVVIPGLSAVFGNFFLPIMIGARGLAFPRISLLSWYLLILGGACTIFAMAAGGVDTGWTLYTPYSTAYSNTFVSATVLGILAAGLSSILTGLNLIVTVHRMRAPGMTWSRLPLFVSSNYLTGLVQVVDTPVLDVTLV